MSALTCLTIASPLSPSSVRDLSCGRVAGVAGVAGALGAAGLYLDELIGTEGVECCVEARENANINKNKRMPNIIGMLYRTYHCGIRVTRQYLF